MRTKQSNYSGDVEINRPVPLSLGWPLHMRAAGFCPYCVFNAPLPPSRTPLSSRQQGIGVTRYK